MPMYEKTNGAPLLTPAQVHDLLILPTMAASVAAEVATVVHITSRDFRVPLVVEDPTAQFVDEGQEIPPSDMILSEALVRPAKIAGLTVASDELIKDSSPEAAAVIGEGLARDIARRIDESFFGAMAPPAPAGLGSLVGFTDGGTSAADDDVDLLDLLLQATFSAETVGATLTHFVTSPAVAQRLALVKVSQGSALNALSLDPTTPTRRLVAGVPLLVSSAVAPNTIWGIDSSRAYLVVREDASVEADSSVYFSSHRWAIRAVARVGAAFAHPASIVKITASS